MNDTTAPAGRPHRTVKVPHLVMGLLFAGVVALWALVAAGTVGTEEAAFLVPGVLVAAGVLGLLASVLSGRNRRRRPAPPPPAGRLVEAPRPRPHDDRLDDLLGDGPAEHDEPDDPDDLDDHTAPVTPTRPYPRHDRPEETR